VPARERGQPDMFVVGSTAIDCTATFTQSPVTTIMTDPLNLPVTVDGVNYLQTPVNQAWTPGTRHTISTAAPASTATSPVRYVFRELE